MNSDLRSRARRDASSRPAPELARLRAEAEAWRDYKDAKADLEERLKQTNILITNAEFERLPALMDELGVSRFDLPPDGNHPGVSLEVKPHYHANIAADWPEEKRSAAFRALTDAGHGDLIRTEVTISLPREDHARLAKLTAGLEKAKLNFSVKESVHFGTLTAWVREQLEAVAAIPHKQKQKEALAALPPLEVIGARVGRVCRPKMIKEG